MTNRERVAGPSLPLVGRSAHLGTLAARASAARGGQHQMIVLDGPAGVGKTSLLRAALDHGGPFDGMTVLYGTCRAVDSGIGYSGVRGLFGQLNLTSRRGRSAALLRGSARHALPALTPDPADVDSTPGATYPVLNGLYWLAANLMAERPLVLALDDAHRCDERSLRWLDFLLRRADGMPLLVVLAQRTDSGAAGPALSDLVAHHRPHTLPLAALPAEDVGELARRAFPGHAPRPSFVAALTDVTGGNPLELHRLLHRLRLAGVDPDDHGARRVTELGGRVVASTVHEMLDGRPEQVRDMARALAVLGPERTEHLAALAGVSVVQAEEAVDILRRAALVQPDRNELVHDMVRAAVLSTVAPAALTALRTRAAQLLSDVGRSPEQIAGQLLLLPRANQPWMTAVLLDAAAQAEQRGAPEAAVRYLERVVRARPNAPEVRMRLAAVLSETDPARSLTLLGEAMDLAGDVRTRATVAVRFGLTCLRVQRSPEGARVLTEALDALTDELGTDPEPADRELLTLVESALLTVGADEKATLPAVRERAARLTTPPGDTPAQRQQLAMLTVLTAMDGRSAAESVRQARRALRSPDVPLGTWSLLPASLALSLADESGEALDALDTVLRDSRRTAAVWTCVLALATRASVHFDQGGIPQAMADAQTAVDLCEGEEWGAGAVMPQTTLALALTERGEPGRAEAVLDTVKRPRIEEFAWEYHSYLMARARARRALGDTEGALDILRACGDSLAGAGLANPVLAPWWLDAACLLAESGRFDEARRAAAHGTVLAERWGTARALGYAALARGAATPGPAGTALLEEAVARLAASPARADHARALLLLGRALLAGGAAREAREHLRDAVAVALRCGCSALARQAREELVAAGGRMREITVSPVDMLTGTERTVAALVASGVSNREAAETLFVTVRTVELHLTSVYRKLGVTRRADLAGVLRGDAAPPGPAAPPRPGASSGPGPSSATAGLPGIGSSGTTTPPGQEAPPGPGSPPGPAAPPGYGSPPGPGSPGRPAGSEPAG
ncbi:helix-turn-helix transcriptional regulator [Streptomyces capillispiralis]|uniref:Putative ATPase n=1 Tax=Streptomyces capillispiralis TaxID=68182 RepID=A0A561T803_9ACTN|nr:LuxR family transcriptional regulator [Streptomyces capillispiralis]TWF83236.1 putative ATPase [Streptomyces capillispiralis]GHH94526.1 LuxR family transcriptional regulator [Streptomyces capillispiralis]